MSVTSQANDVSADNDAAPFKGLEGVEALVNSDALQILRELGHGPEIAALMKLAQLVEAQEAELAKVA
jgi:hypothetical protein